MKAVLVVQQVNLDTADFFIEFLNELGIAYDLRNMEAGDLLPDSIKTYAGYCMLGGPMSVNDEANFPFLRQEKELVREAIALSIPVIGHCLGGQLMSVAMGGAVKKAILPEIGWHAIQSIPENIGLNTSNKWFGDQTDFTLFQWHNESFSIPPNAVKIARSLHCENQAFVINDIHLAMQFHCEVSQEKVAYWALNEKADIDALLHLPSIQSSEEIFAELPLKICESQVLARSIYGHWAKALK
nr:type 1 glutamine amidotransferase [uncultured Undibacterium sp.]